MIGIIAGSGRLPALLSEGLGDTPHRVLALEGVTLDPALTQVHRFRIEALGTLLASLPDQGIDQIVLAGAVQRPEIHPARLDAATAPLVPRLTAAMQGGDDALLRVVISLFEEAGCTLRGAHEVLPGLLAGAGLLAGPEPAGADLADATRAEAILDALGPVDVGQGAVVAGGLCLGIETIQGTDALLRFVADTPEGLRRGKGVFAKRPKPGQDLRVDMPAIGPATIRAVAEAGLAGIVLDGAGVMILDRAETLAAADAAGLFLLGR